ncbi:MAG TPA: C13 family peptidase [Xanthomonadales bacterium]|nr:C13 family peptidase [Xanthomonadales bacterium]
MFGLLRTLGAGLLLALVLRPPVAWRIRPAAHFWWLLLVSAGLSVVRDRLAQPEPVSFYADGIQGDALSALLMLAAAALVGAWSGQRVLTWSLAVLASAAGLWIAALVEVARWAVQQYEPNNLGVELAFTATICVWWLLAWLRLITALLPQWGWWRQAVAALTSASLTLVPFFLIEPARYWYPDLDDANAGYADAQPEDIRSVKGSAEELIYRQPALVEQAVQQLAPGTPGVTDAYLLAFGGDANEDVFRNEVEYAQTLFAQRFGMQQRTLVLLNNPDTTDDTPLATLSNLRLALAGIGARMDRKEDLLVLFMTTHGSEDHQLFIDLQPLALDWIDPTALRGALDGAGIDWRVVIVAACYSGGFIDSLATPMSLIITAARADRPSFGCGSDAELTYFGRAFLVDALNQTTSLPAAFDLAREAVAQREKDDDFEASEPQMAMGALIGPRLQAWTSQLPPAAKVAFVPAVPKEACVQTKEPCP